MFYAVLIKAYRRWDKGKGIAQRKYHWYAINSCRDDDNLRVLDGELIFSFEEFKTVDESKYARHWSCRQEENQQNGLKDSAKVVNIARSDLENFEPPLTTN